MLLSSRLGLAGAASVCVVTLLAAPQQVDAASSASSAASTEVQGQQTTHRANMRVSPPLHAGSTPKVKRRVKRAPPVILTPSVTPTPSPSATGNPPTVPHPLPSGPVLAPPVLAAPSTTPTYSGVSNTFGVALPSVAWNPSVLDTFSATVGKKPELVTWALGWEHDADFYAAGADRLHAKGYAQELTWMPNDYQQSSAEQPKYTLSRIIDGSFDAYITRWATQIKAWDKPLRLRFGHEMNGDWYPWSEQANGNSPGQYVAAWRHVHDIFDKVGADNVSWVWSPNVAYPGSIPFSQVYPGDEYVDIVSLDGYNWGTTYGKTWQSFSEVFSASIAAVQSLTSKPLYISETGSAEAGGDKAAWITDMFTFLAKHPEVRGFTWFERATENDWRIESSARATAAFAAGVQDPRYR